MFSYPFAFSAGSYLPVESLWLLSHINYRAQFQNAECSFNLFYNLYIFINMVIIMRYCHYASLGFFKHDIL